MATALSLDLGTLVAQAHQAPGLTPNLAGAFVEACAVCLEHNRHPQGIALHVDGFAKSSFALSWPATTPQIRSAHNDLQEATERGATCVAIHLAREVLQLQLAQRSRKGGGFDYWLCPVAQTPSLFQNASRMEVSGILNGSPSDLQSRVKQKKQQMGQSSGSAGYAIVIEFSKPHAHIAA